MPFLRWSSLSSWRGKWRQPRHKMVRGPLGPGRRYVPLLEALEDRTLLSGATLATALTLPFLLNGTAVQMGRLAAPQDVDLYALALASGDRVNVDVAAQSLGSGLNSALRVFNAAGDQVAFNDDMDGSDPRLTFQAAVAGTYFLGISSSGDVSYDPKSTIGAGGFTTGL